jgi:hypothetical protein
MMFPFTSDCICVHLKLSYNNSESVASFKFYINPGYYIKCNTLTVSFYSQMMLGLIIS